MASDAAWKRAKRQTLLSQGLCSVCGENPLDRDGIMCSECLKAENERKRDWARRRVKAGKCPYCKNKAIPGKPYCAECKARIVAGNKVNRGSQKQERKQVS